MIEKVDFSTSEPEFFLRDTETSIVVYRTTNCARYDIGEKHLGFAAVEYLESEELLKKLRKYFPERFDD